MVLLTGIAPTTHVGPWPQRLCAWVGHTGSKGMAPKTGMAPPTGIVPTTLVTLGFKDIATGSGTFAPKAWRLGPAWCLR